MAGPISFLFGLAALTVAGGMHLSETAKIDAINAEYRSKNYPPYLLKSNMESAARTCNGFGGFDKFKMDKVIEERYPYASTAMRETIMSMGVTKYFTELFGFDYDRSSPFNTDGYDLDFFITTECRVENFKERALKKLEPPKEQAEYKPPGFWGFDYTLNPYRAFQREFRLSDEKLKEVIQNERI
ncbi:hypothetical protein M2140_000054 [Clostridiales Family XIII bacterium PM5-7]